MSTPINFSGSFTAANKFTVLGKDVAVFLTGSHSKSFTHQKGVFNSYRSNVLDNRFSDAEQYSSVANTTGYVNFKIKLNDNNKLKYNTLFVNTGTTNLYEQGRNGLGYVFDQDPQEEGAFVRDQNFLQTTDI